MLVAGVWVGWGLGDWSHNPDGTDRDNTVRRAKKYMRAMFRSYAGHLEDSNKYDQQMHDCVVIMQGKLVERPMNWYKLLPGQFIPGVLDMPTQLAMGFKKPIPNIVRPIIFTVEGHRSNMFFGPCASGAETLQNQGVCWWKPVKHNETKFPFDNPFGVEALFAMLSRHEVEGPIVDGKVVMWPFPPGTPWGIWGFSQGAMIISEFMAKYVLPPNAPLHWRLKDFRRGLGIGNPRREFGKCAPWADNPPPLDTGGIMGGLDGKGLFVTTGTAIEGRWQENANEADMFAQNKRDKAGQNKTIIAKVITEGGLPTVTAMFAQVMKIFMQLPAEALPAISAAFSAIVFLARNPNPHYTTVAEPGDIEWMRGVAA